MIIKIGIYGGSFNPVHKGHRHLAEEAKRLLNLDQILLIPGAVPPHKSSREMESGEHRLNMLSLAFEGMEGFTVSDLELKRQGISYTADTIDQVMSATEGELYLIMGGDMYLSLESWHRFREIIAKVVIVTAPRMEDQRTALEECQSRYAQLGMNSMILPISVLQGSSTDVRHGCNALLPAQVERYIRQNQLYQFRQVNYTYPIPDYQALLKKGMDEARYHHSLCVAEEAVALAKRWGADEELCYLAGLLHDITKCLSHEEHRRWLNGSDRLQDAVFNSQPQIWHGFSGAEYLWRELKLYNCEIIEAVRIHSTGKKKMSLMEKIIYVADLTSADRDYPDVEMVRSLSYECLDQAVLYILRYTLNKLIKQGSPMLLDTVEAYNDLLL